jgi:hypothetical protein
MRIGALLLVWAGLYAVACGADDPAPPPTTPDPCAASESYGCSTCGRCVEDACQTAVDACSADPGCADYFVCLEGCPLDVLGNVDDDCEAACPTEGSSTSRELVSKLTFCRRDGDGRDCACGQTSVLEQDCPPSVETNPCYKCEDENCCDTYAACHNDPECTQIAPCAQACGDDDACWNQCFVDHAAGMASWGPRFVCFITKCPVECSGAPLDPCYACVLEECEQSELACDSNIDCWLLSFCITPCGGGAACVEACKAQYPGGVELFEPYAICAVDRCKEVCG